MITSVILLLAFTSLLSIGALAQKKVPRFDDFPVNEVYIGKTAPLIITREQKSFRTRIKDAATEKPNFAGHYILTGWGCGMGCWHGVIINARTGRVSWLPYSLCCAGFDDKPADFRLDSKLLIFSDLENRDGGTFFYKLEKDRFVLIHSIKKEAQH